MRFQKLPHVPQEFCDKTSLHLPNPTTTTSPLSPKKTPHTSNAIMDPMEQMSGHSGPLPAGFNPETAGNMEDVSFYYASLNSDPN